MNTERSLESRLSFHEDLEIFEVDFSDMAFTTVEEVDRAYDLIDERLAATEKRWYFLVNYQGCAIQPEVWDRFAERGKNSNITSSLGTVRIGATEETRETIRAKAEDERFRAHLFDNRDEALHAIGRLRRLGDARETLTGSGYLVVEGVHLRFGGIHALQGVGFSVQRGEVFSIIGPNGAGKTSMLNIISGFYTATEGRISFDGADRSRAGPHEVASLGFARTFQNIALFKGMSTLDNIMTGRLLQQKRNVFLDALYLGPTRREEIRNRARVEQIIDFLEIQAIRKTPVGRLPYGLQKRVELGRALAMEPKVLLLDEPMAGMNVEEKEDMVRFILDVNDQWGITTILIEHDMGVVMDISNYVVVLDHGEKIAEGTADEVRTDPVVIRAYLGQN